jgi:hypothetical protein
MTVHVYIPCVWLMLNSVVKLLDKQSGQTKKGEPQVWGLGQGLTTPHYKKSAYYEMLCRVFELCRLL